MKYVPLYLCSLLAATSQFSIFIGQAEKMLKACVMQHAQTHKVQMSGPTVHSYTVIKHLLDQNSFPQVSVSM